MIKLLLDAKGTSKERVESSLLGSDLAFIFKSLISIIQRLVL